jgi:hypothetical protein
VGNKVMISAGKGWKCEFKNGMRGADGGTDKGRGRERKREKWMGED